MTTTLPPSYNTEAIYSTLPQYIQDEDAQNGHLFWWYLYGSCKNLDNIDVLTRDGVGNGIHIECNFDANSSQKITDAQLATAINATQTSITIFGTDSTWNFFNGSSSFQIEIVDPFNNIQEIITIPGGYYNWLQPFITFTGITRGTPSYAFNASMGADGSVYLKDYAGAPGWSQILDISRCPDYALPWFGQFLGAVISPDTNLDRQQKTEKIIERAGFNRATIQAIVAEIVAITNLQIGPSVTPLGQNQILVMEQTQPTGSTPAYIYNQYAITLLVPSTYFSNYTYQSLYTAQTTTYGPNYTNLNQFMSSIGGFYYDLSGSTTPSSSSPYVNFVYRYRPAGIQIFVGGY
jgi:hypothetical protein